MAKINLSEVYQYAKAQYAQLGVDTDKVINKMKDIRLSLHCWQGDDVQGFEPGAGNLGDGLAVTGNYPGKAGNIDELRVDLQKVLSLLPGKHRLNLHAIYGDFKGKKTDRDEIDTVHYASWVDWAKDQGVLLDFNATCFSHPKASDGFTLSHPDEGIRRFWIRHVEQCRKIAAWFGESLQSSSVHNLWIPDGSKDTYIDKTGRRDNLKQSLDTIFATHYSQEHLRDSVESKLFGIGSESFVVGSHEFYMGYATQKGIMYCLDMGHFHPTETITDKISAMLAFTPALMLHVSRGVRWDSDHIVTFNDDVKNLAHEIIRANALDRVYTGLDFFDASINRIGAWVTGAQATLKAFMYALLEPVEMLKEAEHNNDLTKRLMLLEESKTMPFDIVWNYYCSTSDVPTGTELIAAIQHYEKTTLSKRNTL